MDTDSFQPPPEAPSEGLVRDKVVLAGDKVLSVLTLPTFHLGSALSGDSGDGGIAWGIASAFALWPVTIVSAVTFGPLHAAYERYFHVQSTRERERRREAYAAYLDRQRRAQE